MKQQPIAIITAELTQLDYHSNVERTNALRMELLDEGYSIIGVKIGKLTGFLVETKSPNKLIKLAKKYEQSSIFFSDVERETSRISCLKPKSKDNLGKLKKSDKMELDKSLNISFIEDGKQYFFTTEG